MWTSILAALGACLAVGQTPASSGKSLRATRPGAPAPDWVHVVADVQEKDGEWRHLKGHVVLETAEMLLRADEVDINDDSQDTFARGHVEFEDYSNGDKLKCDHAEYNLDSLRGKFYEVSGTSPSKIQARPGLLTTSNPFYFEGKWAERIEDKYVLHDGFITDCKVPKPWWTLKGPKFDVIPGDRALAYRAIFRVRMVPIFYAPVYYKSLKRLPRKSGFLEPNIGNSSRRGKMIGGGYYWAINPSYDLSYRAQYFTERGVAHDFGFRGKVKQGTDFSAALYGVNDTGLKQNGKVIYQASGFNLTADGRSDLGKGWFARGEINYLSSFRFRQEFTESFHEAITSESHSVGFITKHWSTLGVNFVSQRDENFLSTADQDKILIRKLPEVQFLSREREVSSTFLPVWVSLDSSAGLVDRDQPAAAVTDPSLPAPLRLQTRRFVDRTDFYPHAMTALHWKGFSLVPSFALRETNYGSSVVGGKITGADYLRSARELNLQFLTPSLARIFKAPKWMGVEKVKHVVEARAEYRLVDGIDNFSRAVRFDEMELMSNTNQVEFRVTNRLYSKSKNGAVNEILTWDVAQQRYFDPTFGGAVVPGQRNVIQSSEDISGFAFLDGPRSYSPIISELRFQQKVSVDWRTDYDPLLAHIVNSSVSVDTRLSKYFISVGHNQVRDDPVLTAPTNQFRATLGYGDPNRRGWNAGFSAWYDYKLSVLQFATTQVTYNTDCCGISIQFRRFSFGQRNENQFRVAFAVSNVGSFGTLKRQERIF